MVSLFLTRNENVWLTKSRMGLVIWYHIAMSDLGIRGHLKMSRHIQGVTSNFFFSSINLSYVFIYSNTLVVVLTCPKFGFSYHLLLQHHHLTHLVPARCWCMNNNTTSPPTPSASSLRCRSTTTNTRHPSTPHPSVIIDQRRPHFCRRVADAQPPTQLSNTIERHRPHFAPERCQRTTNNTTSPPRAARIIIGRQRLHFCACALPKHDRRTTANTIIE